MIELSSLAPFFDLEVLRFNFEALELVHLVEYDIPKCGPSADRLEKDSKMQYLAEYNNILQITGNNHPSPDQ